ncbi:MAG: slipin family protein [candidate division WOR-3 bacterium]
MAYFILVVIIIILLSMAIRILAEYERGVVFRLGRFHKVKGPGLILLIPFVDRMVRVSLRVVTLDVPPQDVITRDNISVKVNAVAYFKVFDPQKAIIEVENYLYATSQISQTTLRSVLGEYELDDLLTKREMINQRLQKIIDQQTDPWGIKVTMVEIKHVDIPEEMKRAIARQAEAERERRAKVIHADGELQAAAKLREAAEILSQTPAALQLRYLGTLTEIAAEKNSTIIFPLPIEILSLLKPKG